MPNLNLGLDDEITAVETISTTSTGWATRVAALLRALAGSDVNPFGSSATLDAGDLEGMVPVLEAEGRLNLDRLPLVVSQRTFASLVDYEEDGYAGLQDHLISINETADGLVAVDRNAIHNSSALELLASLTDEDATEGDLTTDQLDDNDLISITIMALSGAAHPCVGTATIRFGDLPETAIGLFPLGDGGTDRLYLRRSGRILRGGVGAGLGADNVVQIWRQVQVTNIGARGEEWGATPPISATGAFTGGWVIPPAITAKNIGVVGGNGSAIGSDFLLGLPVQRPDTRTLGLLVRLLAADGAVVDELALPWRITLTPAESVLVLPASGQDGAASIQLTYSRAGLVARIQAANKARLSGHTIQVHPLITGGVSRAPAFYFARDVDATLDTPSSSDYVLAVDASDSQLPMQRLPLSKLLEWLEPEVELAASRITSGVLDPERMLYVQAGAPANPKNGALWLSTLPTEAQERDTVPRQIAEGKQIGTWEASGTVGEYSLVATAALTPGRTTDAILVMLQARMTVPHSDSYNGANLKLERAVGTSPAIEIWKEEPAALSYAAGSTSDLTMGFNLTLVDRPVTVQTVTYTLSAARYDTATDETVISDGLIICDTGG